MTDNLQIPPQADNRYRVHRSVKCYVAELACGTAGCTWYFSDSIERVVYIFPGRIEQVQYKTNFHRLQPPSRMKEIVTEQLRLGGSVHIGGRYVSANDAETSVEAYSFIDVSSNEDRECFERFRTPPATEVASHRQETIREQPMVPEEATDMLRVDPEAWRLAEEASARLEREIMEASEAQMNRPEAIAEREAARIKYETEIAADEAEWIATHGLPKPRPASVFLASSALEHREFTDRAEAVKFIIENGWESGSLREVVDGVVYKHLAWEGGDRWHAVPI